MKSSTQRHFEDRLGQTIKMMDESHKSRSEKLDSTLLHMQTDMRNLSCRLLDTSNFEDRLGQSIKMMDESQRYRSEKMDSTLLHMQADMRNLSCRLLDLAVSMQRLEVKLDRIAESGTSLNNKSQQWPQKRDSTSPADLPCGASHSMGSQYSDGSEEECDYQIKRIQQDAEPLGTQEIIFRKFSSEDQQAVNRSIENVKNIVSEPTQSFVAGADLNEKHFIEPVNQNGSTDMLFEIDTKFVMIDKKLERISASMKIKSEANDNDDEEDRRRLKEKLKVAIEVDRRSRILTIVSKREVWLEYIFGICSPDQRIGKRGSRWHVLQ